MKTLQYALVGACAMIMSILVAGVFLACIISLSTNIWGLGLIAAAVLLTGGYYLGKDLVEG